MDLNPQNPHERPPYVRWEYRPQEDRTESLKQGCYVSKDVAFAIIMRPGSKDTVERPAEEWLADLARKARENLIPQVWVPAFQASFEAWKKGEALPLNGTAIKTWPALSPSQREIVLRAGILTVEDLANFPDTELSTLGVGGLTLKQRAQAWLRDRNVVAEENAALKLQVSALTTQVQEMAKQLASLKPKEAAK